MLVIAQVAGHLLSQGPLQDGLGDLGQQSLRAQQLHALGRSLAQQLISQLVIDQRPAARPPSVLRGTFAVSVIACPSASRISLRLIVRPRHLHSR
jgi:hypothetical protein